MASTYYKIIPIKHLLKNNKIAKSGDVVEAGEFVNLQDSLDRGFCKQVKEAADKAAEAKKAQEAADKAAEAKKAQEAADKAAEAKKAQEAADKAAEEAAKGSDDDSEEEEEESVDLSTLSEKEIIDFAKDNDFKLTKADIKAGKDAMIEAIQKQASE